MSMIDIAGENERSRDAARRVNLDIEYAKWSAKGLDDFYWPYQRIECLPARDLLIDRLLPELRAHCENRPGAFRALRLLIKWLLADMLQLVEASVLVDRFRRDRVQVSVPKQYRKLTALLRDKKPEASIFLQLAGGAQVDPLPVALAKRLIREYQWNNLSYKLLAPLSVQSATIAIQPTALARRHAKAKRVYLHYAQLGRWFGAMDRELLATPVEESDRELINVVKETVEQAVHASGAQLLQVASEYIEEWITFATNFTDFHLSALAESDDIPQRLWTGSVGSSQWLVLLEYEMWRRGRPVIAHDHGGGNAHIEQLAHHFTSFNCCETFYTYNPRNVEVKCKALRAELIPCRKPARIASPAAKIPDTQTIHSRGQIRNLMYVPTAFHGEGARFRPIVSDIQYLDWQVRLLTHLCSLGVTGYYKPHPEGRSRPPSDFAENFGFRTLTQRFEEVKEPVDAYLIDFISSSTTAAILRSDLPVIYCDPGYPELLPEARALLNERCNMVGVCEDADNRLTTNWQELTEILRRKEHTFTTEFADVYYANL